MLCNEVEKYIASAQGTPFFYAVGDDDYAEILSELKQRGIVVDRVSDFCPRDDKYPDLVDIIDHFRTLDIDCNTNKHVLIGLGEYLALRGSVFAEQTLRQLKNTTLGTARVILLLRSVRSQVDSMVNDDIRLSAQKRVHITPNAFSMVSISRMKYSLKDDVANGVKGLLRRLEDGAAGICSVNTNMEFRDSIYPVSSINTAYEALVNTLKDFDIAEKYGTEDQWNRLFQELSKKKSLDTVYTENNITNDIEDKLYLKCAGLEFRNWLYFIFLKQYIDKIENEYLKYVVEMTEQFDLLKNNILNLIIGVDRSDPRYEQFYWDRKKLISGFPESDLAIFVHANEVDPEESIYRFTDTTDLECSEIIKWISKHGYIEEINTIYPALRQYLADYVFDCGDLSELLTQYFKQYRMRKIKNYIDDEFLEQVISNAKDLPYTRLETRDSAILNITEKQSSFLYWIDALGVEFLPYITALVEKKGLAMHVDITYAELPTITSINKSFYENWPGSKFKEEKLDDIKHKAKGGYSFEKCDAPIHLVSELKVIECAVDRAATKLAMHTCKTFVIASDHGASRLAVIQRQEEKYETDTKGEHSGRCCKEFDGCDLPYAILENGYLVLADYGRFKGSRAANVEVHGGASLEEVIVPVITLKLKKQSNIVDIKVIKPDSIYADRHNGTSINLYISDIKTSENVSIVIGDKRYKAVCKDATHFAVDMPDIKRAKKDISANVFDGDDLVGNVRFNVKGKMAAVVSDFDDLI
ncbi:MAG: BREX-4 system phosphatase PglZ [Akkermansiaceae bacterium]|nr:BREX-4 system phosphatase PglZ [Akkermansiaceae bacterium]